MDVTGFVGGAATVASVTSFIPQAYKIVKTRDTSGISVKMYAVTVTGFMLWTLYGLLLSSYPLIVANGLCLLLSSFILTMKALPKEFKNRMLSDP